MNAMSDRYLYSQDEVKAALLAAGASEDESRILSAVAMVESPSQPPDPAHMCDMRGKGDIAQMNDTWGPSVSCFQIRTLKSQTGTGGPRDIERVQGNLPEAAKVALEIARGQGYRAWATWQDDYHLAYLEGHRPPAGTYYVKAREGYRTLAERFGVPEDQFRAANPSDRPWLHIGQRVNVYVTHKVKLKDTLSGIAKQYDVPLEKILEMNPDIEDPNLIRLGQEIKIPKTWSEA